VAELDRRTVRLSIGFADDNGHDDDLYEANMAGAGFGKKKLLEGVRQGVFSPDGHASPTSPSRATERLLRFGNIVVSNADGSHPKQVTQLHDTGRSAFNGLPMADRSTSRDRLRRTRHRS